MILVRRDESVSTGDRIRSLTKKSALPVLCRPTGTAREIKPMLKSESAVLRVMGLLSIQPVAWAALAFGSAAAAVSVPATAADGGAGVEVSRKPPGQATRRYWA